MNVIIGGVVLLVMLVSRSPAADAAKIAYEIFHNENKAMCAVKRKAPADDEKTRRNISEAMEYIENGTIRLSRLLRERAAVYDGIERRLRDKSRARTRFDEAEVERFARFVEYAESQNAAINERLRAIGSKRDFKAVKEELLHNDADYDLILNKLNLFNGFQREAADALEDAIDEGRAFLETV
ncbi:MAG: hypothetical protein LBL35_00440 [Clostridiales bacterium]|jgi:hypothetical protein|nr:hypothetical protein [Clostridiales bacterium]